MCEVCCVHGCVLVVASLFAVLLGRDLQQPRNLR